MPSSLSLAMPSFAMPMRETETGLLLAGMVAQNRRDWQEAWENFSRLNDKYTDNPEFALKAFTLALGNGQYNKAKGLAIVAERLGIDRCDVLAIGDGSNDREMIGWAGYGVAMGNSPTDVRAAADETTLDNDSDGAAVIVERYL